MKDFFKKAWKLIKDAAVNIYDNHRDLLTAVITVTIGYLSGIFAFIIGRFIPVVLIISVAVGLSYFVIVKFNDRS